MQKIAQEVSPLLTEFSNDIALNEDLNELKPFMIKRFVAINH
jgi:hypothetical protein